MKEEIKTIFNKDDIVVVIGDYPNYVCTIGEIYKVYSLSAVKMDNPDAHGECYGGCQKFSQLRHATYHEIQAYNEGIRNIKYIKYKPNYYFY